MRKSLFLSVLLAALLFCQSVSAKVAQITDIYIPSKDDGGQVMELAKNHAIKSLLEREIGSAVTNELKRTMSENTVNKKTEYRQYLDSQMQANSSGFVKVKQIVTQEWVVDNGVRAVKTILEAEVFEDEVTAKLLEAAKLYAQAGKMAIIVQTVYVNEQGRHSVMDNSPLVGKLAENLGSKGFVLVGDQEAKQVIAYSEERYNQLLSDSQSLQKLAESCGADVILYGRMMVIDKGVVSGAQIKSLNGQVKLELQGNISAVQASTGEVLATKAVNTTTMGINVERAILRAIVGKGANFVVQMAAVSEGIDLKLKARQENGDRFVVVLQKVTNYRKLGAEFLAALNEQVVVGQLKQVKETSFDREKAELTVEVNGNISLEVLKQLIFDSCDRRTALTNVDLVSSSGHKIVLTL